MIKEDHDGKPDETGTLFIDILFSLVVGQILQRFVGSENVGATGWLHLGVAFTLTLSSWIGYHNSRSRADARLRFPTFRRPMFLGVGERHANNKWKFHSFWQFVLDVSMVVVYWVVANTAEYAAGSSGAKKVLWFDVREVSAQPEAVGVFVALALYLIWDFIGINEARFQITKAGDAFATEKSDENEASLSSWTDRQRRRVRRSVPTAAALALSGAILCVATHSSSTATTRLLDAGLIALLLVYRYAKEAVVAFIPEHP